MQARRYVAGEFLANFSPATRAKRPERDAGVTVAAGPSGLGAI